MDPLTPERAALAARYLPLARRLAWRHTKLYGGDRDENESTAVYAAVEQAARPDDGRGVPFRARVHVAARGRMRDSFRRATHPIRSPDRPILPLEPWMAGRVDDGPARVDFDDLLDRLRPSDRDLARLLLAGHSQAEIAAAEDCPPFRIYNRVVTLRSRIERLL